MSYESYQKYRADPGLNQSFLKQVIENKVRTFKPSKAMLEGSGIDCLLYTPDEFNERYTVFEDVPTGAMKEEIEKCVIENETFDVNLIANNLKEREFQSNWTEPTLIKNISKYEDYANTILEGIIPISSKDYFRYNNAVSVIKKSEAWKDVFRGTNEYQKDLYANYMVNDESIRCKGLLDDLWIGDDAIITDCKTTSAKNMNEWIELAKALKYPMQAAFYSMLVERNYDVENVSFQWLVYFNYTKQVRLIKCNPFDLYVGKHGCREIKSTYYTPKHEFKSEVIHYGYDDALHIWQQAKELGLPDYDIEHYYSKGITQQSLFF